jgi:hypothetical protein
MGDERSASGFQNGEWQTYTTPGLREVVHDVGRRSIGEEGVQTERLGGICCVYVEWFKVM